ncbi:MAG: FAD-dependent oxidoreductase [Candidatus Bipolaricaulota bacterium]|nr:FAD-dependent oxidoreductase [Candidatus Bipolaricaulota bacterium]
MKTDVLVIGGSAAGIVAATVGKSCYPDKEFLVLRDTKQTIVPCGIPYIFGSLENSDKDLIPDAVFGKAGVDYKVARATQIDAKNKLCRTEDGEEISYDKLVLATGSTPRVPSWLPGTDLENVFTIPKDKEALDRIIAKLQECKKVVTIGGGFIGVEVSDEINKLGKEVTIVEILPQVLGLAFDPEIAKQAEDLLVKRGVKLRTGVGVAKILGEGKTTGVELMNGEEIEADAVILSMGYAPNTSLAEKAGLSLNSMGFIRVDEYMRTETPDIFAIGDCAEKHDFVTRKPTGIMLASTAASEARVAGTNLYRLSVVKTFSGTISIFATAIGDTGFGVAGLTETAAKKEGFNVTIGTFTGVDKHPGTIPGTHSQYVKLIVGKASGVILGGEVVAGVSTGELTNIIGLAIQAKMPISSLLTAQIGTHPLLTAPPTAYPVIKAAESMMRGCGR